jgi:hypothetical protein
MLDFTNLSTPGESGDVLFEPEAELLPSLIERNQRLLDDSRITLAGRRLTEIRRSTRDALCPSCESPIIVTGHQPDFIHPGVWAKHVVASALARSVGGKAVNLVVDSDAPNDTSLDVPTMVDGSVVWHPVRYTSLSRGGVFEHIPTMNAERRQAFAAEVRQWLGAERYDASCLPLYFDALDRAPEMTDWVDQMVHARKVVENSFSVDMIEHRVSRVWGGPLLVDIVLNAERFAQCHNDALNDYRRRYHIRGAARPVPDLVIQEGRVEIPAWALLPGAPRRRVFVSQGADHVTLYGDDRKLGSAPRRDLLDPERSDAAWRQLSDCALRPRALSLTLWARLLLADLFIHGIGGALYDRVTDDIIRRYFNTEPPAMACVSATLRLEFPTPAVSSEDLVRARRDARDIRYNPQRFVTNAKESALMLNDRDSAIAKSKKLRESAARDRAARREAFERIREINEKLSQLSSLAPADADARFQSIQAAIRQRAIARRRDFFFAMAPRDALEKLAHRLAASHSFRV